MSQAEIYGAATALFVLGLEQLSQRIKERTPIDTPALYERIFRGGMPTLISGSIATIEQFIQLHRYLYRPGCKRDFRFYRLTQVYGFHHSRRSPVRTDAQL